MRSVANARVHLALPRSSPFLRYREKPSASVLVEPHPGRTLSEEQVESIRAMIAQAVPELDSMAVAVTDAAGKSLGRIGSERALARRFELDSVSTIERETLAKIGRLLPPVAGRDGFTAEVSATVDFTQSEAATQTWNADQPASRSRSVTEESGPGAGAAGGVPGALSNQPPALAEAPEQAAGAPEGGNGAGAVGGRYRRTETVNNELDRQTTLVRDSTPVLERLTAAVVLDDVRVPGADGSETRRPWTPEELRRVEAQIASAIGFRAERGDVISVTNARFAVPAPVEPIPAVPLWEQPWVLDLARQIGVGLLALVLALGVLRPLMRNLVNRDLAERQADRQVEEQARLAAESGSEQETREAETRSALQGPSAFERNLETVRHLVATDPRRAANVMKEWVAESG
jgi:flagellar M-ring protein FliF